MSHHLTNLAWDIELRGQPKLVLLALAKRGRQSDAHTAATIPRLVIMCGISDSSVRAQLKALIKRGYVTELPNQGDGERHFRLDVLLPAEAAE